jgi:hypothetical protein
MPHNEQGNGVAGRRYLAFDDGHNVGDDEGCWACETFLGFFVYRSSPSSLVKTMHFNATCGKAGKEFVISIAVITKAVDKDNLGDRFSIGLAAC